MPPAFALSQDQTLRFIVMRISTEIPTSPNRSRPLIKGCSSLPLSGNGQTKHPHKRLRNAFQRRYITDNAHSDEPRSAEPDQPSPPHQAHQISSITNNAITQDAITNNERHGRRQRIPS